MECAIYQHSVLCGCHQCNTIRVHGLVMATTSGDQSVCKKLDQGCPSLQESLYRSGGRGRGGGSWQRVGGMGRKWGTAVQIGTGKSMRLLAAMSAQILATFILLIHFHWSIWDCGNNINDEGPSCLMEAVGTLTNPGLKEQMFLSIPKLPHGIQPQHHYARRYGGLSCQAGPLKMGCKEVFCMWGWGQKGDQEPKKRAPNQIHI